MNLRVLSVIALSAVVVGGLAKAEDRAGATFGNIYVGVMSGAVVPEAVHFERSAVAANGASISNGKWEFDTGTSVSVLAGYRFNDYFGAEAEIGYAEFNYDKVTATFTVPVPGFPGVTATQTGTVDVAGRDDAVTGLLRGIATPFGRGTLTPMVGAGFGLSAMEDRLNRIGPMAVNAKTSSIVLAAEATVGLAYRIAAAFEAGVRYRYMWVGSGHDTVENFTAHNLLATLTCNF